ncbi:hypothetical protein Q1695_010738 [Nippostrongylus brasiliensis]|nr:hypothetical protein Q1695_010738 [Nippostrongylus brasiliensis]
MRPTLAIMMFCTVSFAGQHHLVNMEPDENLIEHIITASPYNPVTILTNVIDFIKRFIDYSCSTCIETINNWDEMIEAQSLKPVATKFCEKLQNAAVVQFCKTISEDILDAVYEQMKKYEIKPQLCAHLRICDSCEMNSTMERTRLEDFIAVKDGKSNAEQLHITISELQATLRRIAEKKLLGH